MTKIYMVTDGDYSDYHVVGVYSTPELAEKAKEIHNAQNDVDVLELDTFPQTPPGMFAWYVYMTEGGDQSEAQRRQPLIGGSEYQCVVDSYSHTPHRALFEVWARDAEHAIKIAAELRRPLIASGKWKADFDQARKEREEFNRKYGYT